MMARPEDEPTDWTQEAVRFFLIWMAMVWGAIFIAIIVLQIGTATGIITK